MAATSAKKSLVEEQALQALQHLSQEDKSKVIEYIDSLITLEKVKNDQTSTT